MGDTREEAIWTSGEIRLPNGAMQGNQLDAFRYKSNRDSFGDLSRKSLEEIPGREIPGTRYAIPQVETYRKYGDASRKVEIDALEERGTFPILGFFWGGIAYSRSETDECLLFYAMAKRPLKYGYAGPGAYVCGNRKSDALFARMVCQNFRVCAPRRKRYNYSVYGMRCRSWLTECGVLERRMRRVLIYSQNP